MKSLNIEDVIQVCIGSTILAIPIAFTEEAWKISSTIPALNLVTVLFTSLFLNACFIYYGVYEGNVKNKSLKFFSRILINYLVTFFTVFYILFILNILSMSSSVQLIISKVIIVAFPASLSGAIVDSFDKE